MKLFYNKAIFKVDVIRMTITTKNIIVGVSNVVVMEK